MRVSGAAVPCLDLKTLRSMKCDGRCWQVLRLVFSQGFGRATGGEGMKDRHKNQNWF